MRGFDNRRVDLTYYTKKTSNQILSADVSKASGFSSALVSAGVISNHGVEAWLNLVPLQREERQLRWDMTVNRLEPEQGRRCTATCSCPRSDALGLSVEARKDSHTARCSASAICAIRRRAELLLNDGLPQAASSKKPRRLYAGLTGGIDLRSTIAASTGFVRRAAAAGLHGQHVGLYAR